MIAHPVISQGVKKIDIMPDNIKTEVKSNLEGKLKGREVVLKDNIMLIGVPMIDGASTLEGYIPDLMPLLPLNY